MNGQRQIKVNSLRTVYHDLGFGLIGVAHAGIQPGVGDLAIFNDEFSFPTVFFDLNPKQVKIICSKCFRSTSYSKR